MITHNDDFSRPVFRLFVKRKQRIHLGGKNRKERPNIGGASAGGRNGAPSRKGCVANGLMTKVSSK